jgi:hypothetical protein
MQARATGEQARRDMVEKFNPQVVTAQVRARLEDIEAKLQLKLVSELRSADRQEL